MTRATAARLLLALGVLVALATTIYLSAGSGDEPATNAASVWTSPADCRGCHETAWREWETSPHREAWRHVNVQAAFRSFGFDRKCESCHAAEPILQAGAEAEPALRADDRDSGVNCLTCHLLPDGQGVAATRDLEAPCRPVAVAALPADLCGACHEAIHRDWKASRYAAEGKTCRDCHFRPTDGHPTHLCPGGRDPAMVRSAASVECRQEGDQLVVAVENHGAGHNFPGERHHRMLLVEVVQRTSDARVTLAQQAIIKGITPFRGETSAEKIVAGQRVEHRFPVVEPPCEAEVKLLYKTFPWIADADALVVARRTLALRASP